MLNSHASILSHYLAKTARVLDATGTDCPELHRIANAWGAYQTADLGMAPLVAEAVLTGSPDVPTLHALALAVETATPVQEAGVRNAAAGIIYQEARTAYAEVAQDVLEAASALYDTTVEKFAKAADTVPPETPAADVVKMPTKAREAWMTAQTAAADLDGVLPVLVDAAHLLGRPDSQPHVLALAIDPSQTHRRRVWDAWNTTTGHTRRWGALHALGLTIRAGELDTPAYREPRPLEIRTVVAGRGMYRQIQVDPENPTEDQPAEAKRNTSPRALAL